MPLDQTASCWRMPMTQKILCIPLTLPQECSELPSSPSLLGLSVVQGILLLNLHPELLNNFT